MIKDKIIEILDRLPEEEQQHVLDYAVLIERRYQFNWNLFGKGVEITDVFEEAEKIIALWEYRFSSHLSEETKKSIYYDQFKWHIFSYEKVHSLTKDEARSAFDEIRKDELYLMYEGRPFITRLSNAKDVVAVDFDSEQDVYIFDTSCTWTYVHTHESYCGPYFTSVSMISNEGEG